MLRTIVIRKSMILVIMKKVFHRYYKKHLRNQASVSLDNRTKYLIVFVMKNGSDSYK